MISIDVRGLGECFVRDDGKGWCHRPARVGACTCDRHAGHEHSARALLGELEELLAEHSRRLGGQYRARGNVRCPLTRTRARPWGGPRAYHPLQSDDSK